MQYNAIFVRCGFIWHQIEVKNDQNHPKKVGSRSAAHPNLELENPFLGQKNEVSATDDMWLQ